MKPLTLITIKLAAVALLFFVKKPDQTLNAPLPEASERTVVAEQERGNHSRADKPAGLSPESPSAEIDTQVDASEQHEGVVRDYVPGYFDAPEHLQTGIYKAINVPGSTFPGFVEDMECVSGNCNILIRVTAAKGLMTKAADLMASINTQFEGSSLTEGIVVGIVSVHTDENGEGLIEFVTMEKPAADDSE